MSQVAMPEPMRSTGSDTEGSAGLWEQSDWGKALTQFTRACHLTISIYDDGGVRRLGPIQNHPVAHLMEDSGAWSANGIAEQFERKLVADVLESRAPASSYFEDALLVHAFPLEFQSKTCGVLVAGWTFDQFADPIRCSRLANRLGVAENVFWLAAREISPTSRERFSTYLSLLKTMVSSILGQLSILGEVKKANRIKDQFLATASHELRTPLTSMQLRVELLRRAKNPTPEQLAMNLDVIDKGIRTQEKLVNDLLEMSRVSTGKLRLEVTPVQPEQLVIHAVETVTPAAEAKGVQVTLTTLPVQLRYEGDSIRLQQVFWNLLNNAVKFTPSGGFVAVTVREAKGEFQVQVEDSGKGIDTTDLARLFEPFFQVRNNKNESNSGLGLGLSVAKAVLELHGGRILVRSPGVGLGSTFTATLPAISKSSGLTVAN